jgi:hypothetical protein
MSKYRLRIQPLRSMLSNSYGPEVHRSVEYRPVPELHHRYLGRVEGGRYKDLCGLESSVPDS